MKKLLIASSLVVAMSGCTAVGDTASAVGSGIQSTANFIGSGVVATGKFIGTGVKKTGNFVVQGAKATGDLIGNGVMATGQTIAKINNPVILANRSSELVEITPQQICAAVISDPQAAMAMNGKDIVVSGKAVQNVGQQEQNVQYTLRSDNTTMQVTTKNGVPYGFQKDSSVKVVATLNGAVVNADGDCVIDFVNAERMY